LPEIISIEEFVFKLVPLKKLDEIELFFKLYPIVENCLDNETTFNDFLNYASTLLKDFDDLDMNLTDGQKVFSYLSDAKAIELWNPEGTALSSSQRSYLDFYNHLATIYKLFKAELLSKSESYMGMAFRYLAENEKLLDNKLGFKHIFIAGFNAMTNSEEQIIKTLHQKHGAQLIWDVDAYYYHDLQKEAGAYLRKYNRWTSSVKEQLNHNFLNKPKQINTIGCPGTIAQARMAAEILKKNYDENRNFINRTTIVPADENILLALLNSFPESILGHTNITMGFPLRFSNSYKLLNCIIQLHSNAYRLNKIDSEQARFLSEDFMQLIKNDLIKIYSANLSKMNIAERFISQQSLIDLLELKGKVKLAYLFMSIYEDAADLNLLLIHFFKELKVDIREHENIKQLEQELDAIIKIVDLLENFEKMFNEHKIEITVKSYHILVHKLLDQKKQSFEGRTEDGLQIMGLLETRLLDFENVIILSANEDILPSSPFSPTFIPYDVKSAFELPGLTEKTAIYAYHFYRLLQRAKRIDILYSTSGKKLGGSDKSRFLRQLDYELKDYNSEHILNQRLLSFASPKTENHSISIEKEEQLIEKIKQLTVSGLSLSAINTYILCQLKFYFGYLAEITEPESEKDIIDDRVFGNIIHDFLEKEYKKIYLNNWNVKSLNTLKNAIPEKLPFYFKKNGISSNIQDGSLYLDYKNIIFYLKKFIDNEIEVLSKNTADFKIIGIEEKLHRLIKIGKRHDVKIKGRIDRIDVLNGFTRILDYKTGKVDTQDLNFRDDSFQDLFTKPKKAKTLQLFLYKWLYGTLNNPQIKTGIVSLQNIHNPYLILENSTFNNEDFEEALHGLVEEILNPEINFMQTEDFKVCEICIYKNICRR
jgi:ATP-dependent helicase/nuclease subunit B